MFKMKKLALAGALAMIAAAASPRAGNRQRSQMSSLKTSAIVPRQLCRDALAGPSPVAAEPAI